MANLNLSEFGEKLFVADADHTFIWDSAASISKRVSRNSWLSGTNADFHLGLADAASPVAQTISVQSVVAGTTNTAGANLSINGSQGTGTGAGGSLLLRTAPAGSSGTAQNALVTAVAITSAGNVGIGTTAPVAKLHIAGGDASADFNSATIALGFGTTGEYRHFIHTRHAGTAANNFIDFYTSSGVASGVYPTNAVHGMTITNGSVGIGTTSPTSKLHVAETWNAVGTTFTAVNVNVTDTASAATSKLLDLQIGGASRFSVEKDRVNLGTQGYYSNSGNSPRLCSTSGLPLYLAAGGDVAAIGFTVKPDLSVQIGGYSDGCRFYKDGNHQLGLRDGANGQTFSVYGTYPGAAWERFTITAPTSGNVLLGTYKGTGGIARGLEFQTDGVTRMTLNAAGTSVSFPAASILLGGNFDEITPSSTAGYLRLRATGGVRLFSTSTELLRLTTVSNVSYVPFIVESGDVEVTTNTNGLILKSPDGTRYRVTVANGGTLSVAAV